MKRFIVILVLCLQAVAGATVRNVKSAPCSAVGNGIANDTAAINTCIALLVNGDTLLFPSGTYLITSGSLTAITVNNVIVDGSSGAATIKTAGAGAMLVIGATTLSSTTAFTSNAAELATTIAANFSGISVSSGDYIFITQLPSGGSGARGEVLQTLSAGASSSTVTTALHQAYTTANTATVQKITAPVSGVTVQGLVIDGGGTATNGLNVDSCMNCTISNVTVKNVKGTNGPFGSGAEVTPYLNFGTTFTNITISGAVNSGTGFEAARNGNMIGSGITISGMTGASTFGFVLAQEANGVWNNVSVDSAGTTGGRPFKLNSAPYDSFDSTVINHAQSANYNGITLEFFSAHDLFTNCSVINSQDAATKDAHGIVLYGDVNNGASEGSNHYATFYNCSTSNNQGYAVIINDNNNHVSFLGGTYAGLVTSDYLFWLNSAAADISNFNVIGTTMTGPAFYALNATGAPNGCASSNTLTAASSFSHGFLLATSAGFVLGTNNTMNGFDSSPALASSCVNSGAALATLSSTSLSFGNQNVNVTSSPQATVLTNGIGGFNGGNTLTFVTAAYLTTGTQFALSANACTTTVTAGSTCSVSVTFTPTSTGAKTDTLTYLDNAAGAWQTVALNGTGINTPPGAGHLLSGGMTIKGGTVVK